MKSRDEFSVVATDLDGTLLRSDATISDRTREAIAAAEASGVRVVLVSGRPHRTLVPYAEMAGIHGELVCAGGATVYDTRTSQITYESAMDAATVRYVVETLLTELPGAGFATEYGHTLSHDTKFRPGRPLPEHYTEVADAMELAAEPALKVLIRHVDMDFEEMLRRSLAACAGRVELTYAVRGLLEVSAVGVHKAATLSRLYPDATSVVAIGDMPNDLPMLDWAGHAVAVANAHPDVLAIADEVTASNDDDGVALVLERLT